jgi:hypothetical protein
MDGDLMAVTTLDFRTAFSFGEFMFILFDAEKFFGDGVESLILPFLCLFGL